jgi:hypothetical protein
MGWDETTRTGKGGHVYACAAIGWGGSKSMSNEHEHPLARPGTAPRCSSPFGLRSRTQARPCHMPPHNARGAATVLCNFLDSAFGLSRLLPSVVDDIIL